jgi:hypothetical protein
VAEPRHRRAAAALAAAVLATGLAACSDPQDDYCETFLDSRQRLSDLAGQQAEAAQQGSEGVDVVTPTLESFEELRTLAPEELQDEWDTLVFAYRDLVEALEAAGVDPADFLGGEPPEDLPPDVRRELARVAGKIDSPRVVEAANGVEGHAAQVCEDPAPEESP